ncbi:MAG: hypothetical protein GX184_10265 [Clostridiaceae bacterium]|nr:hypothetical protein [Clostridiaceae bacterium]
MPTIIACLIAGICLAGFVTIWFSTVYKELSLTRNSLYDLEVQLRLHEKMYIQAKDGPNGKAAASMFETSRMLCFEAAKSYNRILNKPMNRIPAMIMGFRAVVEENKKVNSGMR